MTELMIKPDDLSDQRVRDFMADHIRHMLEMSPPESSHALDVDGLKHPGVSLWTIWEGDQLLGSGALSELTPDHGEVKSMRTAPAARRRGVGARMLAHLIAEARQRGYVRLSLETGSMAGFEPARQMYLRHGFGFCAPFGNYQEDPNSVFMTRLL